MTKNNHFNEFFLQFDHDTLYYRLNTLPFHIATLLDPRHIDMSLEWEIGQDGLRSYLSCLTKVRQELLAEVLLISGLSKSIAEAVSRVQRHVFVPSEFKELSYLNSWIPFGYFSAITMPGLVALMIERLQPQMREILLEVGCGSGYHAACTSEVTLNSCHIYGVEINHDFYQFGTICARSTGYKNIKLKEGDGFAGWPKSKIFNRIYIPAAFQKIPKTLLNQLADGGTIQGANILTKQEFEEDKQLEDVRRHFRRYDQYESGDWRQAVCVRTWRKEKGRLTEISKLYGVRFVLVYRDSADQFKTYHRTTPFSKKLLHFAKVLNSGRKYDNYIS